MKGRVSPIYIVRKPRSKNRNNRHIKRTNWLSIARIRENDKCTQCDEVLKCMTMTRRNVKIFVVPEMLYSFRYAVKVLHLATILTHDIIGLVLQMAFKDDIIERRLTRPMVKLGCGCGFHTECYDAVLKIRVRCMWHGVDFN